MKILTFKNITRTLYFNGVPHAEQPVTHCTYRGPDGRHSAASVPGWLTQDGMLEYLKWCWREYKC